MILARETYVLGLGYLSFCSSRWSAVVPEGRTPDIEMLVKDPTPSPVGRPRSKPDLLECLSMTNLRLYEAKRLCREQLIKHLKQSHPNQSHTHGSNLAGDFGPCGPAPFEASVRTQRRLPKHRMHPRISKVNKTHGHLRWAARRYPRGDHLQQKHS